MDLSSVYYYKMVKTKTKRKNWPSKTKKRTAMALKRRKNALLRQKNLQANINLTKNATGRTLLDSYDVPNQMPQNSEVLFSLEDGTQNSEDLIKLEDVWCPKNEYESVRHLETGMTSPQCNNAPPMFEICAPDIKLHTGCDDTMDEIVYEVKNDSIEEIYIKEEPLFESDNEVKYIINDLIKKENCSDDDEENWTGDLEIGDRLNKNKMIINTGTESFQCSVCEKMFTQNHNLENHMKLHKESKKYQCFIGVCQKWFTNKSDFDCHIETHDETHDEEKKFQCFICKKLFKLRHHLKEHQKIHSGVKEFECHICKKLFGRKADLKIHLKIHSGTKEFQCTICQKQFIQRSHLKQHLKIHNEGKEFQCTVCHKLFSRKANLLMHSKSHADKKEFQCVVCKKLFLQSQYLTRHMKTHQK